MIFECSVWSLHDGTLQSSVWSLVALDRPSPIRKGNWKRTNDKDTDSDSSHAPTDKLTSDHSSDHIVSDDNVSVTDDISLEISILPVPENDLIYE